MSFIAKMQTESKSRLEKNSKKIAMESNPFAGFIQRIKASTNIDFSSRFAKNPEGIIADPSPATAFMQLLRERQRKLAATAQQPMQLTEEKTASEIQYVHDSHAESLPIPMKLSCAAEVARLKTALATAPSSPIIEAEDEGVYQETAVNKTLAAEHDLVIANDHDQTIAAPAISELPKIDEQSLGTSLVLERQNLVATNDNGQTMAAPAINELPKTDEQSLGASLVLERQNLVATNDNGQTIAVPAISELPKIDEQSLGTSLVLERQNLVATNDNGQTIAAPAISELPKDVAQSSVAASRFFKKQAKLMARLAKGKEQVSVLEKKPKSIANINKHYQALLTNYSEKFLQQVVAGVAAYVTELQMQVSSSAADLRKRIDSAGIANIARYCLQHFSVKENAAVLVAIFTNPKDISQIPAPLLPELLLQFLRLTAENYDNEFYQLPLQNILSFINKEGNCDPAIQRTINLQYVLWMLGSMVAGDYVAAEYYHQKVTPQRLAPDDVVNMIDLFSEEHRQLSHVHEYRNACISSRSVAATVTNDNLPQVKSDPGFRSSVHSISHTLPQQSWSVAKHIAVLLCGLVVFSLAWYLYKAIFDSKPKPIIAVNHTGETGGITQYGIFKHPANCLDQSKAEVAEHLGIAPRFVMRE